MAITQPALDLLSKNVGIFVARRATPFEIVLLALVVALLPATAAWLIEVAVGAILPALRRWVHALLVASFVGMVAEESIKNGTSLGRTALVLLGGAAAIASVALVIRYSFVGQFLRYLAFAPVVFVSLFLVASPAAALVSDEQPKSVSGASIGNPKRVVMIVMDELPLESLLDGNGRVDAGLYPNFARLAGTSTWYRNDTTVSPMTETAVPALVTGQNPSNPSGVPTASEYPESIFRLLGGGYEMNVHETVTRLCPAAVCVAGNQSHGLARSLVALVKDTKDLLWDFAAPEPAPPPTFAAVVGNGLELDSVTRFVRSIAPSTKPTFDYLHVLLPHQPWRYFPTLQDAGNSWTNPFNQFLVWGSDAQAETGHERHILQLQATDVLLGQVMAKLRSVGAWDNSLVVVTADHGQAFMGGQPMRQATKTTADQILWTPLFMKLPGQIAPVTDDRPVQSIDVVPTIADVLDVKLPWRVDGVSALGPPRPEFERPLYQWDWGSYTPPGTQFAKGSGHLSFPATPNFARVLATRAAPLGGPDGLRPYRIGEYGGLVGQAAALFVQAGGAGSARLTVADPAMFSNVYPSAHFVPWTSLDGFVLGVDREQYLAFAVNGTIAELAPIARLPDRRGIYGAVLPPQLFRPGANDVRAYAISGPAARPVLKPVAIGK